MTCREVGRHLAGYLDGAISGQQHANVHAHLNECSSCRGDLEAYGRLARFLAYVAPAAPPPDLATRIRVQASHAQFHPAPRRIWARVSLFFQNILRPLAVPATGGLLTTAFAFAFLVQSLIVGIPMGNIPNDLPTDFVQPARLESLAPFPLPGIVTGRGSGAGLLIVQATLNANGQVANYRILTGPDTAAIRHQLDEVLIFSRFQPELTFGEPTPGGQVLLSFSEVRVQG